MTYGSMPYECMQGLSGNEYPEFFTIFIILLTKSETVKLRGKKGINVLACTSERRVPVGDRKSLSLDIYILTWKVRTDIKKKKNSKNTWNVSLRLR